MMLNDCHGHDVENAARVRVLRIGQFFVPATPIVGGLDFSIDLTAVCAFEKGRIIPVSNDRTTNTGIC